MGRVEGDLTVMPLADLIIWLANRRLSGKLTAESETNQTVFDIEDGMICRAASNNPRQYFGQFLIHFGLVTEDQLQRAFETQRETKVLLGRILVMIGVVPEEQVIQTLRVKFVENLLGAFRWKDGAFRFEDTGRPEDRPRIEVAVPLVDIHAEGLSRAVVWDEYERLVPDRSTLFFVREDRVPAGLPAGGLDARIIELARQGHSLEALTLELHATDYQVVVRLVDLVKRGALSPREPSVDVEIPDLTGDLPERHITAARAAIANRDFTSAFRHMQAGSRQDPGNPEFRKLRSELETRSGEDEGQGISAQAVPELTRPVDPLDAKRMSAKQRYLLARIDGKRTVQSIIKVSPMHDFEAKDILQQMVERGLVRIR